MENIFIILLGLSMIYIAATSRLLAHVNMLVAQGWLLFFVCLTGFAKEPWFNLNMIFQYSIGGDVYNTTLSSRVEGVNPSSNADRRVLHDRWTTPGQPALYRNIRDYNQTYISTRFVQRDNYLDLTSLSLSYDLKKEWIDRLKFESVRVSFYMNDLFHASTVKQERGLDYPFARSFVFGLNIGI